MSSADLSDSLFDALFAELLQDEDDRLWCGPGYAAQLERWLSTVADRDPVEVVLCLASAAQLFEERNSAEPARVITRSAHNWLKRHGHPHPWWQMALGQTGAPAPQPVVRSHRVADGFDLR